ncbi:MAG: phosphate/phosphite/phosphonate ABC transporter substrate-binding protein [Desulfuromonadaceae bacterium]
MAQFRKRFLCASGLLLLFSAVQTHHAVAEDAIDNIRLGFSINAFVNIPKNDMKIAVQVLAKKVAGKTFGSVDSHIYDSISDIENDLKAKKLDGLAITPDEFIHLRQRAPIEPAMLTVAGSSHEIELLLLVRKDSGINGVEELKGRVITLPLRNAQYGAIYRVWVETLVMKEGGALDTFFSSITEADSVSKAIMPVFFKKVAACVVTKQAFDVSSELNPQLSRELKVVAQIGKLAGGIIVFRKDLSDASKEKMRQGLLDLEKNQEGRQLLMLFHLNGLAPFRSEYMKSTELLYAEHTRLAGRKR